MQFTICTRAFNVPLAFLQISIKSYFILSTLIPNIFIATLSEKCPNTDFFRFVFSHICTEYGYLPPYSV